jgi:methionyl aminopeptidase
MRVAGRLTADARHDRRACRPGHQYRGARCRICNDFIVTVSSRRPPPTSITGVSRRRSAPRSTTWSATASPTIALKAGDIVNIDVTSSRTATMATPAACTTSASRPCCGQRLTETCYAAMWRAIDTVRPGRVPGRYRPRHPELFEAEVSRWCANTAAMGSGAIYHEDPQVLHYGDARHRAGAARRHDFTIEPMINAGKRFTCACSGRLDRGHQGPLPVGTVGAHRPGDRDRPRVLTVGANGRS